MANEEERDVPPQLTDPGAIAHYHALMDLHDEKRDPDGPVRMDASAVAEKMGDILNSALAIQTANEAAAPRERDYGEVIRDRFGDSGYGSPVGPGNRYV